MNIRRVAGEVAMGLKKKSVVENIRILLEQKKCVKLTHIDQDKHVWEIRIGIDYITISLSDPVPITVNETFNTLSSISPSTLLTSITEFSADLF
jgi:hypothetical protein